MVRRMILHGTVTRQFLADQTGLSAASVTKHVQRLIESGLVASRRLPVPHAKKPIDELWLEKRALTVLAVHLRSDSILGELAGLDAHPIHRLEVRLAGGSQAELLRALAEVVTQARTAAREQGTTLDLVGLSAAGLVDRDGGIIYGITGMPRWEACQPRHILPAFQGIPEFKIWSQVACKARGLCGELKSDHRVAYIECHRGQVSLASIHDGEIVFGQHGTSSPLFHATIARSGPACICGRKGCFHALLREGKLSARLLAKGLEQVFSVLREDNLAIEWDDSLPAPLTAARANGVKNLKIIRQGAIYAENGLRAFCAGAAAEKKMKF